jgi:ribonuclease HI/exonuclease III
MKIVQHNLNRQKEALHSTLEVCRKNKIDIILLQEPYMPRDPNQEGSFICIQHSSYQAILPTPTLSSIGQRPRVLAYIRKNSGLQANPRYDKCNDLDIQVIDILGVEEPFSIVNIYNEKQLKSASTQKTVERMLLPMQLDNPALLAGDFNLHHNWWNAAAESNRTSKAENLVNWLTSQSAELLNNPEVINTKGGTFHRSNLKATSVIDLAFAKGFKRTKWINWDYLDHSGSDHEVIVFQGLDNTAFKPTSTLMPPYNYKKADWKKFESSFREKSKDLVQGLNITLLSEIDILVERIERAIHQSTEGSIPKLKVVERSKPWWSPELTSLRRTLNTAFRRYKKNQTRAKQEAYKEARNSYFQAIRKAKETHWADFLEQAEGNDIYTALKFTKGYVLAKIPEIRYKDQGVEKKAATFEEKCNAFLNTLYPKQQAINTEDIPLNNSLWEWPDLQDIEVERAIKNTNSKKAPGNDRIGNAILKKTYEISPVLFNTLYKACFSLGYHPLRWRQSVGIILAKPNKSDYSQPKAYRIISLLNTMGKAMEKIIATRLNYLANTGNLVDNTQMGGRKQRSAIDTSLLLLNHIQHQRATSRKKKLLITTTVFLDIKGAFDYVKKPQLLKVLKGLGLPSKLITWVDTFMSKRQIQLAFEGQVGKITDLDTGVPQGSPISQVLFLIYVKYITQKKAYQLSYIDDFSLSATSTSARINCSILGSIIAELFSKAVDYQVQFEPEKTELIHFHNKRKPILDTIKIGDLEISPKKVVRYLGIWFDSKLSFKSHVEKRTNSATSALYGLIRLATTQKGLSFQAIRRLYIACIISIADYGIQVWWKPGLPQSMIGKYQKLQNLAVRHMLGAFKGSPQKALEVEAAIMPPEIRFERLCNRYALRMLYFNKKHPIIELGLSEAQDELYTEERVRLHSLTKWIKPITQLLALVKRLELVKCQNPLEVLHTAEETPWIQKFPAILAISKESKEKEVKNHNKLVDTLLKKDSSLGKILLYTDGSQGEIQNTKQNAAAVCQIGYTNSQIRLQKSCYWNLGSEIEVADAEVFAIYKALQLAVKEADFTIDAVYIFVDSQAAINKLDQPLNTHITKAARLYAKQLSDLGVKLVIQWCPSHTGILGNEGADLLAKKGLKAKKSKEAFTSLSFLKRRMKEIDVDNWKANWEKSSKGKGAIYQAVMKNRMKFSRTPSILEVPRKHQGAYIQLKTGIGYFKAYFNLIGRAENNRCFRRCAAKQTAKHLLLECKNYKKERRKIARKLKAPLSLQQLFNTKKGKEALAEYLMDTEIATAVWYENAGRIGE